METHVIPSSHIEQWLLIQTGLEFSRLPAGYLDKVLSFAQRVDKLDSLFGALDTVAKLGRNHLDRGGEKGSLLPDFAPYSFTFTAFGFFGGVIYHGSHDGFGSGKSPTLSVCVTPTDGWSVHT